MQPELNGFFALHRQGRVPDGFFGFGDLRHALLQEVTDIMEIGVRRVFRVAEVIEGNRAVIVYTDVERIRLVPFDLSGGDIAIVDFE